MSGHAGFQAIGNHLPPPNAGPQLGGVAGTGRDTEPRKPAGPGGVEANAQAPEAQPSTARSLAQKLDAILLRASMLTTRVVDAKNIASAADAAGLDMADRKALANAVKDARQSMASIQDFTGRQIAAALVADENGVFDWNSDLAGQALRTAIDAQARLSELLTDIANRPEISGDAFEELSELALQCDRRQSEITTLAMELVDAEAKAAGNPAIAKRLDARLSALMQRQAIGMHGNTEFLARMQEQLQPLADRLETFAARPNASISSAEFAAYSIEVKTAAAAIYRAASEGFPSPGGGRIVPDTDFMSGLAMLARAAEKKLEDVRTNIGNVRLRDFAERVVGLPEKITIFEADNLEDLYNYAPVMAKLVDCRQRLRDVCLSYIQNTTDEGLVKIKKLLAAYSNLSTRGLQDEIGYLEAHLKSDMTKDDWTRVRTLLAPNPSSLVTQVVHLLQMARNIRTTMTPEQFLSTDSARALLEGRLSFPTLVEARVHGISDADVDPALDDSRLVDSAPLGSGQVNTVSLVTYADGAQYVFKPEAPGRQMMENLTLSMDYASGQQVAQLNLATQSVANSLGLGDAVPKCTVGVHRGDYGLFMEKVPGKDGSEFAKNKPAAPGSLTAGEVRNLEPEAYGKVLGGVIRGLNRLEWLDLIAGQGDRHAHNYLIDVRADLTVSVKGIDNDQSFPAYRTGLRTYVLSGKNAGSFLSHIEKVVLSYPHQHQNAVRARLENDPGITRNPDGTITLDTTKFESGELYYAAQGAIGMHGCTLPEFIDEDLYAHLLDLKSGDKRDALLADLAGRLSPDALDAARSRLDAAIAHAENLHAQGKVVRNADFSKRDVQNRLFYRELHAPSNPVKPVNGYNLSSSTDIVRKSKRQVRSLFVRDLFAGIAKKGWFT